MELPPEWLLDTFGKDSRRFLSEGFAGAGAAGAAWKFRERGPAGELKSKIVVKYALHTSNVAGIQKEIEITEVCH